METSYEIYPLVQKPLTVSSKSTVWVTLQILWNVSEMRGVCGCPSRSLSKRKLKGRSLNLEAAVHSFWQFAPERQLKCSQFVVHVKKNQHDTLLQWSELSLDFSPTSVSFHESNTMNVFQQQLSESVSKYTRVWKAQNGNKTQTLKRGEKRCMHDNQTVFEPYSHI